MGEKHRRIQAFYNGFIPGEFRRSFTKDLLSFLKTFVILQRCCKMMEVLEDLREAFFKKFPHDLFFYNFYLT